jgi:hypothetical protein
MERLAVRAHRHESLRHRVLRRVARVLVVAHDGAAVRLQARVVARVDRGIRGVVAGRRVARERRVARQLVRHRRSRAARIEGDGRHRIPRRASSEPVTRLS